MVFLAFGTSLVAKPACDVVELNGVVDIFQNALDASPATTFGIKLLPNRGIAHTPEEVKDQLVYLVRHTGFNPEIFTSKDFLEKGEMTIAMPLQLPEHAGFRLVISYKVITGVQAGTMSLPRKAFISRMYLSTPIGDKISILSTPDPVTLEKRFELVPGELKAKRSAELKSFNKDFIKGLRKSIEQNQNDNFSKLLLQKLEAIDQRLDLTESERELMKLSAVSYALKLKGVVNMPDLAKGAVDIPFFIEFSEETLRAYGKFIARYDYNPAKTVNIRDQEELQKIRSLADLELYHRQVLRRNFLNWLLDRSVRNLGGAPVGVVLGLAGGLVINKLLNQQDPEEVDVNVGSDGHLYENVGSGEYAAKSLALEYQGNKVEFGIVELDNGDFAYVPVNPAEFSVPGESAEFLAGGKTIVLDQKTGLVGGKMTKHFTENWTKTKLDKR